ncbi:hypothetical protein UlMin_025731 [Ulmus minor]
MAKTLKPMVNLLLFLAITIGLANSARILDEVDPQPGVLPTSPAATVLPNPFPTAGTQPLANPIPTFTSGQIPAVAPAAMPVDDIAPLPQVDSPDDGPADSAVVPTPVPIGVTPIPVSTTTPNDEPVHSTIVPTPVTTGVAPIPVPTVTPQIGSGVGTATTAPQTGPAVGTSSGAVVTGASPEHPTLAFFMHDITGGSHPTARVVTGLIANTVVNVPFSKSNNNIFPVSGGTPLTTSNINGFLDNNKNNLPFLTGLNGAGGFSNAQTSTIIQNSGNNNIVNGGGNQPFVTAGQLPAGATLQKLMFGSVTVFDDELTEGHELGSSAVIGKAQGFYLASSLDGNSHTMALTVVVHSGENGHEVQDTISIFGVHRTATPVSHVAVIGGTGKYENAQGYATVESLPQVDQHTTDGVDTIMHVSIYLSE